MSERTDKIQRILRRASLCNYALTLLAIAVFGAWIYVQQLPHSYDENDATLNMLNNIRQNSTSTIDQTIVQKATRGKSVFRTARAVSVITVDALGRYKLIGTSIKGDKRKAFVRDTKSKKMQTVIQGEQFGGVFEVLEIQRNELTVKRGNDIMKLKK